MTPDLPSLRDTLRRLQPEWQVQHRAFIPADQIEKVNLWALMQKLRGYVHVARTVDAALTERLSALDRTDPDKAWIEREDLRSAVRQGTTDLLAQLAVTVQGYLALDPVRRNNLELIKGVDRASITTVSALMVVWALASQKLRLDQISALNSTTANLIEGTSKLLKNAAREDSVAGRQRHHRHRTPEGGHREHPLGVRRRQQLPPEGALYLRHQHRHPAGAGGRRAEVPRQGTQPRVSGRPVDAAAQRPAADLKL